MEKNNKNIAIVALIVAVLSLSLGFAAFTSTLKIETSAEVTSEPTTFNVDFSKVNTSVIDGTLEAKTVSEGATAGDATIDNSGEEPVITNLSATFTAPGQSVMYEFYAFNAGEYIAYLNDVIFANVSNAAKAKVCAPATDTDEDLTEAACNGINVSVLINEDEENGLYTGSVNGISSHSLGKNSADKIQVTIEYQENAERADGDFTVEFGNISLGYSSVD